MSEPEKKEVAKSNKVTIEWKVFEDEDAWRMAQAGSPHLSAPPASWKRRWWRIGVAALLLLFGIFGVGAWLWHQARLGENRVVGELQMAAENDQWRSAQAAKEEAMPNSVTAGSVLPQVQPPPGNLQTQLVQLGDDWAIVQVTLTQDGVSYHQTRLYRQGARGWFQDTPAAALWGAPRTLQSSHFLFHYYALDGDAVAVAAAKLDTLYPDLAATYALAPPVDPIGEDKRPIWVSPQPSGAGLQERSPGLYLAPAYLSEGDVLAQAIFLDLLAVYTDQYREKITASLHDPQAIARVTTLLSALRLWQSWRSELPLGALYKPTLQWLYSDRQGVRATPDFAAQLCPLHSLWQATLSPMQIPLFCDERTLASYEAGRYFPTTAPRSLAAIRHLFKPVLADVAYSGIAATEWVGLATIFDYAAAHYGPQSPATLIGNAASYTSWETLIPATFGVAAPDFEKGWLAYLHDRYGVAVAP